MKKYKFLLGVAVVAAVLTTSCVKPKDVSMSKETLEMRIGNIQQIIARQVTGTDIAEWSSSNEKVAIVFSTSGDDALQTADVIAMGEGKATITAKLGNKNVTCVVTVLKPNIYAVGYQTQGDKMVAVVWKDGVAQNLTDGTNDAAARSINIMDNEVFVVGFENNDENISVAKLWRNGTAQNLSNGVNNASAVSVTVEVGYIGDIYAVGYSQGATSLNAYGWRIGKTGGGLNSFMNITNGMANNVFIPLNSSYSECYIAGRALQADKFVPKLWKYQQVEQPLEISSQTGEAMSVYVWGEDVYVAGYEIDGDKLVAKTWKNGAVSNLTDGANNACAMSIFVFAGDVYVAGYEENASGKSVSKIWKNDSVLYTLSSGASNSSVSSLFVAGNDVFAAGYEENTNGIRVAKTWKNGVETALTDGTKNAVASTIVAY